MFSNRLIQILDTTLRDGEQSSGVVFNVNEKLEIAAMLAHSGIRHIEAGTPAVSKEEREAVKAIASAGLPAKIYTWNRAKKEDIDASLECGVQNLFISLPVSGILIEKKLKMSPDRAQGMLLDVIEYAQSQGASVICGLEDVFRSDGQFLLQLIKKLESAGVERIRIADTVGLSTPSKAGEIISIVKTYTSMPIEFHAHNDFGLALANTLAAVEAGADFIDATLLGIGERAGNTSLEELALALDKLYGISTGLDLPALQKTLKRFEVIINQPIWPWKAGCGEKIFTHESGVHADGIIKNRQTYQPYEPSEIGRKSEIVIGKHSGRNSLRKVLTKHNVHVDEFQLPLLLEKIKTLSVQGKRSFTPEQTALLCKNWLMEDYTVSNQKPLPVFKVNDDPALKTKPSTDYINSAII